MPLIHQQSYGAGGLRIFEGPSLQDGSGWGSMLGGLLKSVLPAAKSAVKFGAKMAKKAAKSELGQSLIDTGVNAGITALQDTISGSSQTKEHLQDSVDEAKQKILTALENKKRTATTSGIARQQKSKKRSAKRANAVYQKRPKKRSKFDLLADDEDSD